MKIVTSTEMSKIESKAISQGSVDVEFMDEAAINIARIAHSFIERNDSEKQVTLLCGKGNNAGDAYTAGIHLIKMGYSVDALQLFPFNECSPLCQINQTKFFNVGGIVREINFLDEFALPSNGIIIDGIFGTGFKNEVEERLASIIYKANQSKLPIISIDIPSGLNGDTGIAANETISATETAFLGLPKIGFFLNNGYPYVGKLRYIDFGLPEKYIAEIKTEFVLVDFSLAKSFLPPIKKNRNKYEAGFVVGLAGSKGMAGAALLSSWSALASGSGIVKLLHPEEIAEELIKSPYEIIKVPYGTKDTKTVIAFLNKATSAFLGPGIGRDKKTVNFFKKIIPKIEVPTVLDADVLNILAENKIKLPKNCILTPHKGEMERLLGINSHTPLSKDFIHACQEYAEKMQVTLILKGAPTFIFQKNFPIFISNTGDPGMATAGSGDVLTGLLASLLAQGLSCQESALLAVFLHGMAGESAAQEKTSYCMIASDIIKHFPQSFKSLKTCL